MKIFSAILNCLALVFMTSCYSNFFGYDGVPRYHGAGPFFNKDQSSNQDQRPQNDQISNNKPASDINDNLNQENQVPTQNNNKASNSDNDISGSNNPQGQNDDEQDNNSAGNGQYQNDDDAQSSAQHDVSQSNAALDPDMRAINVLLTSNSAQVNQDTLKQIQNLISTLVQVGKAKYYLLSGKTISANAEFCLEHVNFQTLKETVDQLNRIIASDKFTIYQTKTLIKCNS